MNTAKALPGNRINLETVDQIFRLKNEGKTHENISKVLHISSNTVGRYLNPGRRERARAHRRENWARVTIDGESKWVHIKKRPYPEYCELCEMKKKRYDWHHWNNEHIEWGLWLCKTCHKFAEVLEQGLLEKYLSLKEDVIKVTIITSY